MLQHLQSLPIFKRNLLDNLVDFEKCCKTRIHLQRSVPLQPKGFVVTKWHEAAASPRQLKREDGLVKVDEVSATLSNQRR